MALFENIDSSQKRKWDALKYLNEKKSKAVRKLVFWSILFVLCVIFAFLTKMVMVVICAIASLIVILEILLKEMPDIRQKINDVEYEIDEVEQEIEIEKEILAKQQADLIRLEKDRQSAIQAKQAYDHPECPMCKSHNTRRISTANRALSIATVGLASSKIGKQYECINCKHKW